MAYDQGNPFARILRGELACEKVFENEFALAINDHDPQAPYHALVLVKGHYETLEQFSREAAPEQLAGFFRAIGETAARLGVDRTGYRVVVNAGDDAGQQVPHLHVHVLGGGELGPLVARGGDTGARRARTSRQARSMPGEAGERGERHRPGRDPKSAPAAGPDA
ncbi:MAG: HIT domain-containing protein [Planctomycetes bacterium]|nr:HIT domain-containing protein [Planctomycetota bacterium]